MVRELVHQAQGHLGVLEHVVKRQILDQVVSTVDVLVRVFKCRLNNKGRRVTGLGRRGVVGASIAALGLDPGNAAVL